MPNIQPLLPLFLLIGAAAFAEANTDDQKAARAAAASLAKLLEQAAPPGWQANAAVEQYTVENLYDKIDGRSELFMSYGVVAMAWCSLAQDANPDRFIEVFLYDMGSALGAFGVFSVERVAHTTPLRLGRGAYRTPTDLLLWKGRYYLTLTGAETGAAIEQAQEAIAKTIEQRLPASTETLWGLETLPKEGRLDDSVQYFAVDAMSMDFMTDTFTADYRFGDAVLRCFVSRQADEAGAGGALARLAEYMKTYGEGFEETDRDGLRLIAAEFGGGFADAAFQHGRFVAGVSAVKGKAEALDAARRFAAMLQARN
jgi:hypothetical protein